MDQLLIFVNKNIHFENMLISVRDLVVPVTRDGRIRSC